MEPNSPPLVIASPSPSPTPTMSIAVPSPSTASPAPPAFPPSPPSSCGDQSPPPKESKPPQIIVPVPKVPLHKPLLPFSIENILRPEFGSKSPSPPPRPAFIPLVTDSVLRTPPKTPEISRNESPVDLSHKRTPLIQPLKVNPLQSISPASKCSTAEPKETQTISTNTANTSNAPNSRVRYPENPEELANPRVPEEEMVWPAWVYCTRYSDRPSSGPRSRRIKRRDRNPEEKRPRTAFTSEQLARLKNEFDANRYLDDKRRQSLARELNLNESQIKIWFQNKRAKDKKNSGPKNGLAQHLIAQGLYNHSTMPVDEDDPYLNGTL